MLVDPTFTIIQNSRLFLAAVTPTNHHDILASRFKVEVNQLLWGQLVSGFSDHGTLLSPSNTASLEFSSMSPPKK